MNLLLVLCSIPVFWALTVDEVMYKEDLKLRNRVCMKVLSAVNWRLVTGDGDIDGLLSKYFRAGPYRIWILGEWRLLRFLWGKYTDAYNILMHLGADGPVNRFRLYTAVSRGRNIEYRFFPVETDPKLKGIASRCCGNTFNLSTVISIMRLIGKTNRVWVLRRHHAPLGARCEVDRITRAHLKSKYKLSNADIEGLLNRSHEQMDGPMES